MFDLTHKLRVARSAAVYALGIGMIGLIGGARLASAPLQDPPPKTPVERFAADREVFHTLLQHRKEIRRVVKDLDNGVETVTETENTELRAKIAEHVESMHRRVGSGEGIHLRDPLFAEIFRNHQKITMKVERTPKGVKVTETSDDPHVAKLIQAHARVVTKFIQNGPLEVRQNHPVPEKARPRTP